MEKRQESYFRNIWRRSNHVTGKVCKTGQLSSTELLCCASDQWGSVLCCSFPPGMQAVQYWLFVCRFWWEEFCDENGGKELSAKASLIYKIHYAASYWKERTSHTFRLIGLVSIFKRLRRSYCSVHDTVTSGGKFVENLAADIKISFPDATGYSGRNLKYMAKFALRFSEKGFVQAALAQIP